MLFNHPGRKRSLRTDCLTAAAVIQADAELATYNAEDLARFEVQGLRLLEL